MRRRRGYERHATDPGAGLGAGTDLGGIADGIAGFPGGGDRAARHPAHLRASLAALEWTVNAYTPSFAALTLPLALALLSAAFPPHRRAAPPVPVQTDTPKIEIRS
jgi:hypothetical protein